VILEYEENWITSLSWSLHLHNITTLLCLPLFNSIETLLVSFFSDWRKEYQISCANNLSAEIHYLLDWKENNFSSDGNSTFGATQSGWWRKTKWEVSLWDRESPEDSFSFHRMHSIVLYILGVRFFHRFHWFLLIQATRAGDRFEGVITPCGITLSLSLQVPYCPILRSILPYQFRNSQDLCCDLWLCSQHPPPADILRHQ
jgi:hypothetical protein